MNTDTAQKIGDSIKRIRLEQDQTQADVAKRAGLSTNYYARIERGDAAATIEALQKIARALSVKSADILPF